MQFIPLKRLKHRERNPRKITAEALEKLMNYMKKDPEFLERRPILCYPHENGKDYVVYAGNQRVRAAKKLKLAEIPCVIDEYPNEETIRDRVIIDNLSAGENDWDILSSDYEMEELLNLGFTEKELQISDSEDETKPAKFRAIIKFDDEDHMEAMTEILQDFCEVNNLTLSLGK